MPGFSGGSNEASAAPKCGGMSRQKVLRFKQPHQQRGPFASLWHLSGISEGKGFREGLIER